LFFNDVDDGVASLEDTGGAQVTSSKGSLQHELPEQSCASRVASQHLGEDEGNGRIGGFTEMGYGFQGLEGGRDGGRGGTVEELPVPSDPRQLGEQTIQSVESDWLLCRIEV
jgi:hypothetical protein